MATAPSTQPRPARPRRAASTWKYLGLAIGTSVAAWWLALLTFPQPHVMVAKGPLTPGHDRIACQDCHLPAPGTRAQQLSSNVYHWLGLRRSALAFGSQDVDSDACLYCHHRPDDRHPISRFFEPRFVKARRDLGVQSCIACHTEHQGKRVTVANTGYCAYCHEDTALQADPIEPYTHAELVAAESWRTCLQCHDFHGNHREMETATRLADGVPEQRVHAYFAGAPSPYPSPGKRWKAFDTRARAAEFRRKQAALQTQGEPQP